MAENIKKRAGIMDDTRRFAIGIFSIIETEDCFYTRSVALRNCLLFRRAGQLQNPSFTGDAATLYNNTNGVSTFKSRISVLSFMV